MAYYQTTPLSKDDLQTNRGIAQAQDEKILAFFKEHPNVTYTPFEVHETLFTPSTPVDSIKRSLNTLVKGLFLVKTKEMRMGKYGRNNHTWKLRTDADNQLTLI